MNKKIELKKQIEEIREDLNKKILQDIKNEEKNNVITLSISCKLDELIVDYMKKRK